MSHHYLSLYDNGVLLAAISGSVDWERRTFLLPSGSHVMRWIYARDSGYVPSGSDAGWLDEVSFAPGSTLPSVLVHIGFNSLTVIGLVLQRGGHA